MGLLTGAATNRPFERVHGQLASVHGGPPSGFEAEGDSGQKGLDQLSGLFQEEGNKVVFPGTGPCPARLALIYPALRTTPGPYCSYLIAGETLTDFKKFNV